MDIELDDTYDLGSDSLGPDLNAEEPSQIPPQTQQGVESEPVLEEAAQENAKKRVVRKTFDTSRLLSEDAGLPRLRKTLIKTTFKHKGASRTDLKKLAAIYELWGHRLIPRSTPDDIAHFMLKGGEDPGVKAYRKGLVDQDKYGDIAAGGDEAFSLPGAAQANTQKGPASSDSEFDIPETTTAAAQERPNDIPEDDEIEQMRRDDEWDVYKQLGF